MNKHKLSGTVKNGVGKKCGVWYLTNLLSTPMGTFYFDSTRSLCYVFGVSESAWATFFTRMKKKAVFLDRDGVVNVDRGYVFKKEDFEFTPDLFPVLRKLNEKGYLLIVVTNQSGIGRGYYSESDFLGLTDWMLERLRKEGVEITGVYHCPHAPEETCSCRKPEPGMFLRAIEDHNINPSSSWMVGDKPSDMEAAMGAGVGNRVMIGPARSEHGTHTVSRIQMLCDLIP